MSKKRKHKNRHIPHTNLNSTQEAQSMSPNPTQPASSASSSEISHFRSAISSSPPSSSAPSAPADIVFQAVKRRLAVLSQSTDPASPETAQLMDNYVQGLNIVAMERIANLLADCPPELAGSPQHLKILRMLLQSLSIYTRNMSRISRDKAAAQREARARAKEAKENPQQQAQSQLAKAQQTLTRLNSLQRAGAIETESKDATTSAKSQNGESSSCTMPLRHSATSPLSHSPSALSTQNSALPPKDATQNENLKLIPAGTAP